MYWLAREGEQRQSVIKVYVLQTWTRSNSFFSNDTMNNHWTWHADRYSGWWSGIYIRCGRGWCSRTQTTTERLKNNKDSTTCEVETEWSLKMPLGNCIWKERKETTKTIVLWCGGCTLYSVYFMNCYLFPEHWKVAEINVHLLCVQYQHWSLIVCCRYIKSKSNI